LGELDAERPQFKTAPPRTDGMSMSWRLRLGALIFVFATTLVVLVLADFEPTSYGVSRLTGGILFSVLGLSMLRSGNQRVRN